MSKQSVVAFSCGDPNGIGLEVFIKAWQNESLFKICTPVLLCHPQLFSSYTRLIDGVELDFNRLRKGDKALPNRINILSFDSKIPELQLGTSSNEAGKYAFDSLVNSVELIKTGFASNLVTLPINKKNIQSESFQFPGHTEFLSNTFESDSPLMLLISDEMRIGVATGHIPVNQISQNLGIELIEKKILTLIQTLKQDFGLTKPKIAVLGLNPHSGDNGLLGNEEKDVIEPTIKKIQELGEIVFGPYPADAFFGNKMHKQFDGILAMYHDQGLIPFKQLCFNDGTNYTAGLPIVRTSPDHGTAYDIAGQNIADPSSLIHAIYSLSNIYKNRIDYFELRKNPLDFARHKREKFSIGVPNLK